MQSAGTSFLGEVWYAESDTPLGPWIYARKVVTHDRMSFYNPKQHPMFDKDGGRVIFFEGTYTNSFSGNNDATPRYEYNQVMYKLDLSDPRLALPVPVYALKDDPSADGLGTSRALKAGQSRPVAFLALDRAVPGSVPVVVAEEGGGGRLKVGSTTEPLFHAIPADVKEPPTGTVPLYELVNKDGKRRAYSTDKEWTKSGFERSAEPLCLVWRNPLTVRLPAE